MVVGEGAVVSFELLERHVNIPPDVFGDEFDSFPLFLPFSETAEVDADAGRATVDVGAEDVSKVDKSTLLFFPRSSWWG